MAKNMTEGKPLKLILAFMFPVLCGNLFQNFYNIVDSMIVGRFLGVDALAAVGSTTSLNFLVVGWITGMTSGFGILISQAYGDVDVFVHCTCSCDDSRVIVGKWMDFDDDEYAGKDLCGYLGVYCNHLCRSSGDDSI